MKLTQDIEEAKGQLERAVEALADQDAKIQSLPDDTADEERKFHDELFKKRELEVGRWRETLERQIALADAYAKVPRGDGNDPDGQDGAGGAPQIRVGDEPPVYRKGGPHSFFRDLAAIKGIEGIQVRGDEEARLARHRNQMRLQMKGETRAISSTDTAGGFLVAPVWLMDEFVALARAARPFADAVRSLPLPPNTDSLNIPKFTTGTLTATQQDAGAVSSQDIVDTSIAVPVITIAGQQDMSRQLFDRAQPGIDQVIVGDLAADYATKLDVECLNGVGSGGHAKGILQATGINAITYTATTPTLPALYSKLADAIQQVHTGRFLPPSAIFMHPRRWGWCLAALDTQNRPLVVPLAPFNPVGILTEVQSQQIVGQMAGLPVYTDASIPITLGAGTNEDRIIVTRLADQYLWEEAGAPHEATYFEVLSNNLQVRVQVWGYLAYTSERYPKATSVISGTGLVAPTF